jgi:hypothetical protein
MENSVNMSPVSYSKDTTAAVHSVLMKMIRFLIGVKVFLAGR